MIRINLLPTVRKQVQFIDKRDFSAAGRSARPCRLQSARRYPFRKTQYPLSGNSETGHANSRNQKTARGTQALLNARTLWKICKHPVGCGASDGSNAAHPAGWCYLKTLKQTGYKINLVGFAQTNARVSTLCGRLMIRPGLILPRLQ
jgi:hypothetical protein